MDRLIVVRNMASTPDAEVGFYEASMLLAKTYAAWPRHAADALAVYDDLIQKEPQDFRFGAGTHKILHICECRPDLIGWGAISRFQLASV